MHLKADFVILNYFWILLSYFILFDWELCCHVLSAVRTE